MTVVEAVAARLRAQVPSRATYEWAVPDGPLPAAYLLVRAAASVESGERMTETTDHVVWSVWVMSVARSTDPFKAARTADAGLTLARDALRDFRPAGSPWRIRFTLSSPAARDESLPETTFLASVQYDARVNL